MKNLKLKRRKNKKKINLKPTNIAKNKANKLFNFKVKESNSKAKVQDKSLITSWKIPKTTQETIPIEHIYADGIWQIGNRYSKTWSFSDINIQALDEDEKNNK